MDVIKLMGMEFLGFHGCLTRERAQGQTFIIDLEMELDLALAGATDDIAATVNYADIFTEVKNIVEGEPVRLIETLAERIASKILLDYQKIQKIHVTVHKPHAPIAGKFQEAAVKITRTQQ